MRTLDVLIIGTGPAATQVAMKCSEAGRRVGIVDPRPYGGTCALRGCNPKKVLVRACELLDWIDRAEGTGVHVQGAKIEWTELIEFEQSFTEPVTPWKEKKFRDAGMDQFHGAPRFLAPNRVTVDGQEIESRRIVLATGAVPRKLGIPGEELIDSSDDFLQMRELPKRILFIGGGYVTFEFAHVAARAGARVTVVEMRDRPLIQFDPDLVRCLIGRTRELGIDLQTGCKVESIERRDHGALAVGVSTGGTSTAIEVDRVIHGAGRVPNLEGLAVEEGGVDAGSEGIRVNDYLQSTSNPSVYAAGDVAAAGAPRLSPVAREEGRIVAHNLLESEPRKPDYGPVATVVFSSPALAAVGLQENEATEQGFDFTAHTGDRSTDNSMKKVGAKYARYKVLVENASGRFLGAHLLGPDAAETINLFTLAIKHGMTALDVKSTLLAFPTFAHDVRGMV